MERVRWEVVAPGRPYHAAYVPLDGSPPGVIQHDHVDYVELLGVLEGTGDHHVDGAGRSALEPGTVALLPCRGGPAPRPPAPAGPPAACAGPAAPPGWGTSPASAPGAPPNCWPPPRCPPARSPPAAASPARPTSPGCSPPATATHQPP